MTKPLQPSLAKPRRRTARRWIKRGILALLGLGVLAALVYAWLPKPVVVDGALARFTPLDVVVEADGKTRVRDRFVVAAPISGNLARVELEAGDPVADGATVARIQPPDPVMLDDRSRAAAEARLAAAVAHQRQADAAIARAKVARAAAARETARIRNLLRAGAVAGAERDQIETSDELAASDLAAAELARAAAVAEVAAARAALGRGVRGGTDKVDVIAPTSGEVLRVVRDSAGPILAGAPILEVGNPRELELVVDVLSADAARIARGAFVLLDNWGGAPLTGRVRRIEPSAFTHISALGIEEQRVNVVVGVDEPPPALGDGFRVDARITLWHGDRVLAVPSSAVFRDRGRWAVYVVRAGRAELVPIEVGHRGRLDVEIAAGLAPGDVVIIHPGDRVVPGKRVVLRS